MPDPAIDSLLLYHYYEAAVGPFRSLSALSDADAEAILERLRAEGRTFAARRAPDYWTVRRAIEQRLRTMLVQKGGDPRRTHPHYTVVGPCRWLRDWYRDGRAVTIPLVTLDARRISFTYGDSFPALRYQDGRPYRGRVYLLAELPALLTAYGWPQEWNPTGAHGPERYIEAQIWDDIDLPLVEVPE